jgi:hypothetical protein
MTPGLLRLRPVAGSNGVRGQSSQALVHDYELRLQPVLSNTTLRPDSARRQTPTGVTRPAFPRHPLDDMPRSPIVQPLATPAIWSPARTRYSRTPPGPGRRAARERTKSSRGAAPPCRLSYCPSSVNSMVGAMSIMYVRCDSGLGHTVIIP